MDAGPGTDPGTLGFFISTWVVMMAAMMLPAMTPTVLAYRVIRHEHQIRRPSADVRDAALLLVGYLAVWAVAGLLGYVLLEAGRTLVGGVLAWGRAGRWVAAGALMIAALYQLTRSKNECLTRCRSRHQLLVENWREDRSQALRIGIEHGAWCVGCCWALMAALFALGAMSVGWMVLIAVLVAAERLLPWRALATTGIAALLAALAIGLAAAPARVPMLTIPGSTAAMRSMGSSRSSQMPMDRKKPMTRKIEPMKR